ncbi:hypothetical protein F751_5391 [Auxenochlorella protothecoides]|uniref:Uncharacterized protein n=1 Tax=Auxenochlorella protothecoides TaxID=3075 RepID=A0A087SP81_AUXPR|nr:hypothetical protein F751_5391 [Auxenochlorella protothecoides]KFM27535.1 hypothetical protein F751_5391 [Auxenochlorella protothecoides]
MCRVSVRRNGRVLGKDKDGRQESQGGVRSHGVTRQEAGPQGGATRGHGK